MYVNSTIYKLSVRFSIPHNRAGRSLLVLNSVHLWQGNEDKRVPYERQRYVVKLPWIKYHDVEDGGHMLIQESALCEAIFRELVLGEEPLYVTSFDYIFSGFLCDLCIFHTILYILNTARKFHNISHCSLIMPVTKFINEI